LQTILTLIGILVFNINALGNLQGRLNRLQSWMVIYKQLVFI